jgi:hypothetical protein
MLVEWSNIMLLLKIMASIIIKVTQNSSTVCMVELGLWRYYTQTKRNRHRPWCEDGACALGLGVLTPHTMVGAKTAPRHGCGEKWFFGPGMNVHRILYNFQHANTLAARGLEEPCASFSDFCNNRQFHVIISKNF